MRILHTNDDGADSFLLKNTYDILPSLIPDCEVTQFVPSINRSGISGAINIEPVIDFHQVSKRQFVVDAYPTDCVRIAQEYCEGFDLHISGPNLGANLGDDIFYSGTVAAARQSALYGIPSIALSVVDDREDIQSVKLDMWFAFLQKHIAQLIQVAQNNLGNFINVNTPIPISLDLKEAKLSKRLYGGFGSISCDAELDKDGVKKCRAKNVFHLDSSKVEDGTDWKFNLEGFSTFSIISNTLQYVPSTVTF